MNTKQSSANLISIQCLRAVAALVVLMSHIGSIEGLYTPMRFLPAWGIYGVDLFFVISGFVMTYISHDKWGNPSAARPFMFKRILRIYPVYWEFTAVIIVIMLAYPSIMNMPEEARPSVVKSLLLWPQMMDPLLGVGWTLVYEMYFYVLFCCALFLPRKAVGLAFGFWFVALATVRIADITPEGHRPEFNLITSPLAFEFMMGCALAWLFQRGVKINAVLLFAVAFTWWGFAQLYIYTYDVMFLRVLRWGIPSALVLYAFVMIELSRHSVFPAWLRMLGDASFSLYMCHPLLLSGMGKLWHHMPGGALQHTVFILLCFGITLSFALLNYRFFEWPLSRWYHRKAQRV